MNKIFEKLTKLTKDISGNIIIIGINNNKLIDSLYHNQKVTSLQQLEGNNNISTIGFSLNDDVNIRGFRKKFKKKKHSTIICDNHQIKKYYKYFIKDSIYITNDKIYLIVHKDDELNLIKKRYQRYKVTFKEEFINNEYLLTIDVSSAKNNWFKDSFYYIIDTIYNIFEMISIFLLG
jgi:hypothetical protein